jgi:unsaturated chondroitin disaccharide hydrolase
MLGSVAMTGWSDGAVIVDFDGSGIMKARNGDVYSADVALAYTAGASYKIRLDVDMATHRYSVYVTPPSGTEVRIASSYAFRPPWNTATSLGNWAAIASSGSVQTCGFALN